jgi:hypothetical protein
MMSTCEAVLDRVATGEPLSDEQRAHVAGCVDCARLASVPDLLAAAAAEPEPGPGFSSRMQIGARGRLATRKRNRIAGASFAAAAAISALTLAVMRPNRHVAGPGAMSNIEQLEPQPRPPVVGEEPASGDQVARDLVRVSNVDRSLDGEADWSGITHSLTPYRAILVKSRARRGAH